MTARREPLISIVLAIAGVEDYLGACLDSVLGQSFTGVEVIAVDDASRDASGEILDERAARDPRLRVIHLGQCAGPGPARMRGLASATGEYVWFVDPDDLLAPGSLAAIAARLVRDRPDMLLIDYLIRHPSGRTEPSPGAGLLLRPGRDATLTLAERPALVNRTMAAWSNVFRRSFLTGLGVGFSPGIYEDVPVICAALLRAERIGLLDRVCYLYQRHERSFMATASMGHFSIFTSYERVFASLEAGPCPPARPAVTPAVRVAVFARAIEHYTAALTSGLVPRAARRDFFRRMVDDYRRHLPPGYTPPAGPRGVKTRLIARNAYVMYTLLEPLNRRRVAVARLRRGHRR